MRVQDVRDGDVLIEQRGAVIGKVEHDMSAGDPVVPIVRLCDRWDSRRGWWYTRGALVDVWREEHHHTTIRCL